MKKVISIIFFLGVTASGLYWATEMDLFSQKPSPQPLTPPPNSAPGFIPTNWEGELAHVIIQETRTKSFPFMKLPNGQLIGNESPEQLKQEILPVEVATKVINHSVQANTLLWCKLSIEKLDGSFLNDPKKWDQRQSAFMAAIHGTTTRIVLNQLKIQGPCIAENKKYLEQQFTGILK